MLFFPKVSLSTDISATNALATNVFRLSFSLQVPAPETGLLNFFDLVSCSRSSDPSGISCFRYNGWQHENQNLIIIFSSARARRFRSPG